MSLPPALLERLKRRKIIQEVPSQQASASRPLGQDSSRDNTGLAADLIISHEDEHEEIIAEDYSNEVPDDEGSEQSDDDDEEGCERTSDSEDQEAAKASEEAGPGQGLEGERQRDTLNRRDPTESVIGCPHKYNIYHECVQYCVDNYSKPTSMGPTLGQRKQLALILKTFPMSNEWTVVYDPGVKTFYFWNVLTNQVSWVPPGMGTFASLSADQIRRSMVSARRDD